MLDDKVVLVTGVVTPDSIAFGVARRALELGAEVVLTALERDLDQARTAAALLGLEDAAGMFGLTNVDDGGRDDGRFGSCTAGGPTAQSGPGL